MTRRHSVACQFAGRVVCAGLLAVLPPALLAKPSCTFSSGAPVNFGNYEIFATLPNNFGVGSIRVDCKGGGGPFKVTLSTGQSHTFAMRKMQSGPNTLDYNLYTSAGRSVVWGDGSGTSGVMFATKNTSSNFYIFGQIPALQDAAAGTYSDNITATVNF
ncbi:MAG: spore coat protein U domain-containing protein [Burkholderiales bacterium]|nr:spore coat protein U domain-containing protein [Burkholderiales bacterium]